MTEKDYGVAKVRPATPADAEALAPKLREADLRELRAVGQSALEALTDGVNLSTKAFVIDHPVKGVVAMFGVVPTPDSSFGAVWMLGSDDLLVVWRKFLRHSREWVAELFEGYQLIGNFVEARNNVHINWLRWLGFRLLKKHEGLGRNGEDFIEFVRLKE